ncbi:hypothetical protein [Arenibaculum pallidiluteum]|uniref:hypothetical protein n=1 Tax=Arenibaculum pallidiluteum TaxID=2812559 RepID=UPI001A976167|nr:hypothetical protein [Arenibaculum pallidiluteum]
MKSDSRFELSSAWWKANRPKTLPDPGLGKELTEWDILAANQARLGGAQQLHLLQQRRVVLSRIKTVMDKIIKSCKPVLHDSTKRVLTDGLDLVEKENKNVARQYSDLEKMLTTLAKTANTNKRVLEPMVDKTKKFFADTKALAQACRDTDPEPGADDREMMRIKRELSERHKLLQYAEIELDEALKSRVELNRVWEKIGPEKIEIGDIISIRRTVKEWESILDELSELRSQAPKLAALLVDSWKVFLARVNSR